MSSSLWCPEDVEDLLLVTIDPNQSGETEWDMMVLINSSTREWLSGKLDTCTYMDILDAAGIDPLQFVSTAEHHVNLLIQTSQ